MQYLPPLVLTRHELQALRVTSRNLGASLMLLILAQLMVCILTQPLRNHAHSPRGAQGIYLLSTLVQLRTSFPPPPPRPDATLDNLFSTLPEYQLFGSLFDGSFLLAAGVVAVVRWFGDKMRNAGQTN